MGFSINIIDALRSISMRWMQFNLLICFVPAAAVLVYLLPMRTARYNRLNFAPIAGAKWSWEPSFITRYRFVTDGWGVALDGWKRFGGSVFTILRPDSNVTILPEKYIEELHMLPQEKVHSIQALTEDLIGRYTGASVLLGSRLNFEVAQTKVTPKLNLILPMMEDELSIVLENIIPRCPDRWIQVDFIKIMTGIISRLTFRVWVGQTLCRNSEFIALFLGTVKEIFATAVQLRMLPEWMHPIVVRLLPSRYRMNQGFERIKRFLVPIIEERRQCEADGGSEWQKPEDVLQWMMDLSNENEQDPRVLAQKFIFSVIGSLFFVSNGIVELIYDLTAYSEYMPQLREEALRVIQEPGAWNSEKAARLQKMDSFMRESQRINTPSPISFRRIIKTPMTLSDGLRLPAMTYVGVLNSRLVSDPDDFKADQFNGLRSYSKRHEKAYTSRYQYSSTDTKHMNFGYGRHACPGRFLASMETKLVISNLITRYDFRFPEGQGKPVKVHILEFGRPDPNGRILIRERTGPHLKGTG